MKKNIFDFSDFDDNIVNSIAENYPDMNKSQQKSICRKIRKRLNISDDSVVGDVVSGIEIARKRNPWYICGTVAAAVFAVALIPTAFKALKNAPDGPENIQGPPAVDMATAPVEDEEKSTAAVTTKIGESDIIAEVTAPQPPTDETTTVLPTSSENPEKTKETEAPPPPPVTEEKRTTTKALRTTVPQAPPAPTSAPAVSTPVTTTKPVTVPPAPPAISEDGIFNTLANLSYSPYTCDGIADYILTAEDGTIYQILVGCKHVWRNGSEEADITPEILEWVKKYGEPYKVKDHNAKAEIDWSFGDFTDNVWGVTYSGYSEVITNTYELREYLEKIYRDDKVEQYLNQYNDSYFRSNVLALNAVQQSAGARSMLEIEDFAVNNSEIKLTAKWKNFEVAECVMSINLVKLEIPKHMYVEQPINWNIADENEEYYNIRMKEIEEYERQNICTMVRERAILNGEMADVNRLTFKQAEKIIKENGTPNDIYDSAYADRLIEAFNEICDCPDIIGGSGITRYEYWLGDNSGNEKIIIFLEQPAVWYESKYGREQLR